MDELIAAQDLRLLAYWGEHPPSERAAIVRRLDALKADHEAGRVEDDTYLNQVARLLGLLGKAVAVFAEY